MATAEQPTNHQVVRMLEQILKSLARSRNVRTALPPISTESAGH